jgi:hypothetical protein
MTNREKIEGLYLAVTYCALFGFIAYEISIY